MLGQNKAACCTCVSVCVWFVVQQTFAAEGLQYSLGGLTGSTRNSHRLLAWAAAEHGLDKQNQLAELLFNGYFCKVSSMHMAAP